MSYDFNLEKIEGKKEKRKGKTKWNDGNMEVSIIHLTIFHQKLKDSRDWKKE